MSIKNFRKILNILEKHGIFFIKISGGEPLIHPDIEQIGKELIKHKFKKSLVTNGLLIDKHSRTLNNYFDKIGISIDGPEKIHNILRGKNSFKKIIKNLKKVKIPKTMYVTLSKKNCDHLTDIFKIAKQNNFCSIVFLIYKKVGNGKIAKKIAISSEALEKTKQILSKNKSKIPFFLHDNKKDICRAGYDLFNIKANGDVTPCSFSKIKAGNIFKNNFYTIIKKLNKVRKICKNGCCHQT